MTAAYPARVVEHNGRCRIDCTVGRIACRYQDAPRDGTDQVR
jgi:hypothetical protein